VQSQYQHQGIQTLKDDYKKATLFRKWEQQAWAANSQKFLPGNAKSDILLRCHETYINYYIFINWVSFVDGNVAPCMSMTFEHYVDVMFWVHGQFIHTFHEKQYVFPTECILWLLPFVGLQPALVNSVDNQRFPLTINPNIDTRTFEMDFEISPNPERIQEVPSMPRDIWSKSSSSCKEIERGCNPGNQRLYEIDYVVNPWKWTKIGWVNPVPKTTT